MSLAYVVPRLLRHFMPEQLTRGLLVRSLIIKPGLETADPSAAVERYVRVLRAHNESLNGKRVMVFGYGGRFDIGVGLLEAGAASVALCDKYARPDARHNEMLLTSNEAFAEIEHGKLVPRRERIAIIEADVRDVVVPVAALRYDLVVSNSVFEHLDDAEAITRALARLTTPLGLHIHYVDLRDHFFKYPFEMLRYSQSTWRRWLNPTSNHNRLRIWHYRRMFEAHFESLELEVLERDETTFQRVAAHVRPEFKSGNIKEDSVTLMQIIARSPRQ